MAERARSGRDAFTFSLGGMRFVASSTLVPAIASDSLNKVWDERLRRAHEDQPDTALEWRAIRELFSLPRWRRAA